MAFTYNRTDFVENRDYNEKEHRNALNNAIGSQINPNILDGFKVLDGLIY